MSEREARQLVLDWLKPIIDRSIQTDTQTLWHYTSAAGLLGILASDRLWATDTVFLNDAAELVYGRELMLRSVNDVVAAGASSASAQFVLALVDLESGIVRPWLDDALRLYVTCFCTNGDLLGQWRGYGGRDDAGGYAIGMTPPGPLPAWGQSAPHYLTLRKVIYDVHEQQALCEGLASSLLGHLEEDPRDDTRKDDFARALIDGIVEVATWCKHPAFAEEQEWRLTYHRLEDREPLPLLHRAAAGLLVPYVELEVPRGVGVHHDRLPITHIICGPSQDPSRKARGVSSFVETLGWHGSIEIDSSGAPARL